MALVPIIQPVAIKAVTTKAERRIRMTFGPVKFSNSENFSLVVITIVAGLICAGVISWFLNVWELIKRMAFWIVYPPLQLKMNW